MLGWLWYGRRKRRKKKKKKETTKKLKIFSTKKKLYFIFTLPIYIGNYYKYNI